jgi:CheY-like chemotaxis protein
MKRTGLCYWATAREKLVIRLGFFYYQGGQVCGHGSFGHRSGKASGIMMDGKKRVLVVDDDDVARQFVREIMATQGWDAVEGTNGMEALDLAEKEKPDLIILDVMMPVMDGFEAFRRLRDGEFTKHIPVIMLTAISSSDPDAPRDPATMEKRLGVRRPEGFVDKPVEPKFLLDTVFGVIG